MQTLIDDTKLKQLLKEAFIEALEEKRHIFHDLIVEAIEDTALVRAIREGEAMETVSKQDVFNILEGNVRKRNVKKSVAKDLKKRTQERHALTSVKKNRPGRLARRKRS